MGILPSLKNFAAENFRFSGELPAFFIITISLFLFFCAVKKGVSVRSKMQSSRRTNLRRLTYNIIQNLKYIFLLTLSMQIACALTSMPKTFDKWVNTAFIVAFFFETTVFIQNGINAASAKLWNAKGDSRSTTATGAISLVAKIAVWTIGTIVILSNLGFQVSGLVASLGITSIAVAFALQSLLTDIFGSLSIYLDRPFIENEIIKIEGITGKVTKIGIRNTRLESIDGEEIIVSNNELITKKIHNYSRIKKRRALINLPVSLDTDVKKLGKISSDIKRMVERNEIAEFSRAHLKEISSICYKYEIEYYVKTHDFMKYMDTVEKINLEIISSLSKNAILLARTPQNLLIDGK